MITALNQIAPTDSGIPSNDRSYVSGPDRLHSLLTDM